MEPIKSVFFTIVKKRRLGISPNTALSMDMDFDPLENVNDLNSTPFQLYRAMPPLVRVLWWANRIWGFGLMRWTTSCASRNLKVFFNLKFCHQVEM